jgi:hypothetical protein
VTGRILIWLLAAALGLTACTRVGHPASSESHVPAAGSPEATKGTPTAGSGPIRFVLDDRYAVGETVGVRITNAGPGAFLYNSSGYEACNLSYLDSSDREFIIPPGTHCDLVMIQKIRPGETVKLFAWKLDECLKDRWGCVKAKPLAPGGYKIESRFKAPGGGKAARAEAAFLIVG